VLTEAILFPYTVPPQANLTWLQGNYEEAEGYAKKAKIWNVVTTIAGIVFISMLIALILFIILGTDSSSSNNSYLYYN